MKLSSVDITTAVVWLILAILWGSLLCYNLGLFEEKSPIPEVEIECHTNTFVPTIRDLPPGYSLVTNQFGEWRYVRPNGDQSIFNHGQRGEAVTSAWNNYNHNKRMDESKWQEAK